MKNLKLPFAEKEHQPKQLLDPAQRQQSLLLAELNHGNARFF